MGGVWSKPASANVITDWDEKALSVVRPNEAPAPPRPAMAQSRQIVATLIQINAGATSVMQLQFQKPGKEIAMNTYRVMFFKTLTNCYGKSFDVCQRTIDIDAAEDPDRAVEEA